MPDPIRALRHLFRIGLTVVSVVMLSACASAGHPTATPSAAISSNGTPPLPATVTTIPWRPVSSPITSDNLPRLARLGSLIFDDTTINRVMFAPDNNQMASLDGQGLVVAWDLRTGQALYSLADAGAVLLAAYSTDGKGLITVGFDNKLRLWQADTGKPLSVATGESSGVTTATASVDGSALALGYTDGRVEVWSTSPLHMNYRVIASSGHLVQTLAFSPDGRYLAGLTSDHRLYSWDAHTGNLLAALGGFDTAPTNILFAPTGGTVALAAGNTLRLYTPDNLTAGLVLTQTDLAPARGMAFSPDGKLIAAGSTGDAVYLWNVSDGTFIGGLPGHRGNFERLSWSPDGRLLLTVSTAANGGVYLWNVDSIQPGKGEFQPVTLSAPGEPIAGVAWSPDGRRIIGFDRRGSMTIFGIPAG